MGISFDNTGHSGSNPNEDLESKLEQISVDIERTFDRLGACVPIDVRSVEEISRLIHDAEHLVSALYETRRIIKKLGGPPYGTPPIY